MSEAPFTCVKCGGDMIKGFDGEPEHPTLLGIKGDNVKIDPAERRLVRGLRCGKCGYLELYAA